MKSTSLARASQPGSVRVPRAWERLTRPSTEGPAWWTEKAPRAAQRHRRIGEGLDLATGAPDVRLEVGDLPRGHVELDRQPLVGAARERDQRGGKQRDAHSPYDRPITSSMISSVPAPMRLRRMSRQTRSTPYSFM